MDSNFLLKINPTDFTTAAFVIGILLSENLNSNEQNAVGNWFELLGQVLETFSAQAQLLQGAAKNSIDVKQNNDIEILKKAINIINERLNNI